MIADTTTDAQLRWAIIKSVKQMDLRLMQRIAYECRCEEMGIRPDGWRSLPKE